jgi:putative ABC transport system ATP-binding protein
MSTLITLKKVTKLYGTKANLVKAISEVDLEIKKGTYTVILGRSGSGKSTVLNLMAGLDKTTSGTLVVGEDDLSKASPSKLAKYRSKIGIIFQFYNLLPNLNTLENVMMGAWAGGKEIPESQATELLTKLGLGHRIKANVKTLSGGEKQRVAIARSLVGNPEILFCDEPTGALDSASEIQVQQILSDLHKKDGLTIVLVTHNPDFEKFADSVVTMQDGSVIEVKEDLNPDDRVSPDDQILLRPKQPLMQL